MNTFLTGMMPRPAAQGGDLIDLAQDDKLVEMMICLQFLGVKEEEFNALRREMMKWHLLEDLCGTSCEACSILVDNPHDDVKRRIHALQCWMWYKRQRGLVCVGVLQVGGFAALP